MELNERELNRITTAIRRVCEAFEMEDGMPVAEVFGAMGASWGTLGEEQTEALQDLLSVLEELEDE